MITPASSFFSIVLVLASVFPAMRPPASSAGVQRPSVVENGSDVVVRPFATPLFFQARGGFTLTPDGAVYFPYPFGDALYRFDLAGNLTLIPLKRANGSSPIIFAHHKLWTAANPSGVVNVDPDGSNRKWFPLTAPETVTQVSDIATQGDGTYLATVRENTRNKAPAVGAITRIGVGNAVQTTLVKYEPGAISTGDRGSVYFTYYGGFGRIAPDGSIAYLPVPNGPQKPVYSNGFLYFFQSYTSSNGNFTDFSKMNVMTGAVTRIGLPVTLAGSTSPGQIAVDFGGNLWLSVETQSYDGEYVAAMQLFSYNIRSGLFTGPIEPTLISNMYYGDIAVGPDDNVYSFAYFENTSPAIDVYVRHVQTLEPASLSLTAASSASFSIVETHFNGPWTAVSLEPNIAAVFPATSTTGTFSVAEVARGTAQIEVKDRLGNISYETIAAR